MRLGRGALIGGTAALGLLAAGALACGTAGGGFGEGDQRPDVPAWVRRAGDQILDLQVIGVLREANECQ